MVDTNSPQKVQAASPIISSRAPRFWTPERDAEVERGIENREKYESIGRRLGTTYPAIRQQARKLGLKSLIRGGRPSDAWTPATVALLKEGVAAGDPYSKIAMRLGLTKNQCIAKASRLELEVRYTPPPKPRREIAPFPPPGHCVYPIGHVDDPDFCFCGARVTALNAPYCYEHREITMVRVPTKAASA